MKQKEIRQKITSLTTEIKSFAPENATDCVALAELIAALQAVYSEQCPIL